MEQIIAKLKALRACPEALGWLKAMTSLQEAYDQCQQSGWLAWYLGRYHPTPQQSLTLIQRIDPDDRWAEGRWLKWWMDHRPQASQQVGARGLQLNIYLAREKIGDKALVRMIREEIPVLPEIG